MRTSLDFFAGIDPALDFSATGFQVAQMKPYFFYSLLLHNIMDGIGECKEKSEQDSGQPAQRSWSLA
jgi:hypothetical protein